MLSTKRVTVSPHLDTRVPQREGDLRLQAVVQTPDQHLLGGATVDRDHLLALPDLGHAPRLVEPGAGDLKRREIVRSLDAVEPIEIKVIARDLPPYIPQDDRARICGRTTKSLCLDLCMSLRATRSQR